MKAQGAMSQQLMLDLPVSVGIPTGEPTKILAGKPGLQTLLYDQKRDGAIRQGEALALYEDGTTERVREFELRELPPAQDLKVLIRKEHRRAELLRLRAGYDGCGCADCQTFYARLDLSKFGDRVKHYGDCILIEAGKAGADLRDEYHKPEHWDATGQVFFTGGRGYALNAKLETVDIGEEADILKAFATGEAAGDLCPDRADLLRDILDYRKEVKHDGGARDNARPTGKYRVSQARLQRAKPASHAGRKPQYVKSSKAFKRLPNRLSRQAKPGVSDKRSLGLAKKK